MGGGGRRGGGLVRKEGFRRILKKPWSLRQLMRFNLDFKSTFKSTLNSKNSSCIFWGQPRFQENSNFSPVNNNSQCLTSEVWRGCEYYHLEWSSCHAIGVSEGVDCSCADFQISMLYLLAKILGRALICSSVKIAPL